MTQQKNVKDALANWQVEISIIHGGFSLKKQCYNIDLNIKYNVIDNHNKMYNIKDQRPL